MLLGIFQSCYFIVTCLARNKLDITSKNILVTTKYQGIIAQLKQRADVLFGLIFLCILIFFWWASPGFLKYILRYLLVHLSYINLLRYLNAFCVHESISSMKSISCDDVLKKTLTKQSCPLNFFQTQSLKQLCVKNLVSLLQSTD